MYSPTGVAMAHPRVAIDDLTRG